MTRRLRRHRLSAWIALVAMLAFALVPALSRAMATGSAAGNWAEVCTTEGMRWMPAGGGEPAPADAAAHLDRCALCALSADGAAPLPVAPAALWLPLAAAEPPRLFLQAARTLAVWRSAQPRGPPLRS